jgi:DNA polymerase-3 subunit delta
MRQAAPQIRTDVPVSLLYGDSLELRRRAAETILTAQLSSEERNLAVVRLWGREATAERLRQEAASLSLLTPQRVVIVEALEDIPSREQDQIAVIARSLPPGFTLLLLAEAGERGRSSVSQSLLTAVGEAGQVVNCSAPSKELIPALIGEAKRLGKVLSGPAAGKLAELTGDFDAGCRELGKLALFTGDHQSITVEDVESMTSASAETTTFVFCDALGMRDAKSALRHLDMLLPPGTRRGAGLGLMGMIARQLRLVWQAKAVRDARQGAESLEFRQRLPQEQHNYFAEMKGKEWLERKLAGQAARWSHSELARALLLLQETDRRLKGLTEGSLDDRTALQLFVAEVCK